MPYPLPQKSDQLCKNPKPCSYGDRCIFAHNMEEQRRFRQAYSSGSSGNGGSQGDKQVQPGTWWGDAKQHKVVRGVAGNHVAWKGCLA